MQYNPEGLFPAIEEVLKKSPQPMDCQALFDIPEIKALAASANRVSDYLGHLWRKNKVMRHPAPRDTSSKTRWVYEWKGERGPKIRETTAEFAPRILADRPSVLITEDGMELTIETPYMTITVRQKPEKKK